MPNCVVDISAALEIPGWMSFSELQWLAQTAAASQLAVEIGSYVGRSTRAIADNLPPTGQLIAVDDWFGPRDCYIPDQIRTGLFDRFGQNMATSKAVADNRVFGWKQNLSVITPELIRQSWGAEFRADFIFIDGSHEYADVHHDIETWLPFLADGGVISGHDYSAQYPGVLRAVSELVPNAACQPNTTIWFYKKTL